MVYFELGRIPIEYIRLFRMIKYWFRLPSARNSIRMEAYTVLFNLTEANGYNVNWVSFLKKKAYVIRFWEREMFYLTTHSTHFIYGYMASDIWLRTILIVRKETRCRHIGYSYRLAARVLLYAPSHRKDNTYHGLCYTSRGALAGTRNSSMGIRFC